MLLPNPNPLTRAETPPTGLQGPLRCVPPHTVRVPQHALPLAHLTPATLTSCCPSSRKHQARSSLRAFALSVPSSGRLSLREPQDSLLPSGYASKRQPLRESISSLLFNMETAPPPRTLSLLPPPCFPHSIDHQSEGSVFCLPIARVSYLQGQGLWLSSPRWSLVSKCHSSRGCSVQTC